MNSSADSSGFEHLDDELIHDGYIISLFNSRFRAPDGTEFNRDVVRHPGAVSVVPVWDNGDVVLVRQYRAPLDRMMIEIPAGKRDVAGEAPLACARRELKEEVGLTAGDIEELVTFHNSVGFSDEQGIVYRATDLTEGDRDVDGLEEEFMETLRIPLDKSLSMIFAGAITDAKTVIGLTLAARRLGVG